MSLNNNPSITINNDARKAFRKLGTCSRTFFYLLNREFGHIKEVEEKAADPLAGGILQKGHQCGMLWGSSLAVGAEAYRRCENTDHAIRVAVKATQSIMQSYASNEDTINCRDVTNCDFSNKWSFAKYMVTGKFLHCFKMAEEWAPHAIQAAIDGLHCDGLDLPEAVSCATEVAKKMGASEEEQIMLAGFAGGLGLSGSGCGALSAAIWLNSLKWIKDYPVKSPYNNSYAQNTMEGFEAVMGDTILCHDICGMQFKSMDDHSLYIKNGGCTDLLDALSKIQLKEVVLEN